MSKKGGSRKKVAKGELHEFREETDNHKNEVFNKFNELKHKFIKDYMDTFREAFLGDGEENDMLFVDFLKQIGNQENEVPKTNTKAAKEKVVKSEPQEVISETPSIIGYAETALRPTGLARVRQLDLLTPAGRSLRVPAVLHVKADNIESTSYRPSRDDEVLFSINGSPVVANDVNPRLQKLLSADEKELTPLSRELCNKLKDYFREKGMCQDDLSNEID